MLASIISSLMLVSLITKCQALMVIGVPKRENLGGVFDIGFDTSFSILQNHKRYLVASITVLFLFFSDLFSERNLENCKMAISRYLAAKI